MKVDIVKNEPTFSPVEVRITAETKKELLLLRRFFGANMTIPNALAGRNDFGEDEVKSVAEFMDQVFKKLPLAGG